MLLSPIERNRGLLISLYRFKTLSKLQNYVICKGGIQKSHFTLAEILNTLRISIRKEGLYDTDNPSSILCSAALAEALGTKTLQAREIMGIVLSHLLMVDTISPKCYSSSHGG